MGIDFWKGLEAWKHALILFRVCARMSCVRVCIGFKAQLVASVKAEAVDKEIVDQINELVLRLTPVTARHTAVVLISADHDVSQAGSAMLCCPSAHYLRITHNIVSTLLTNILVLF